MRFHSIRSKLMLAVSVLLLVSGVVITFLVTNRLSENLQASLIAQGEHLCHTLAVEALKGTLANDSSALRRLMNHQRSNTPSLAYIFIIRKDRVQAHTFSGGIPAELLTATTFEDQGPRNINRIVTNRGESYLDFVSPVLSGNADVLRMGLLEKPYRSRVMELWLKMGMFTASILLLAITVSYLLIRRITRPLSALAETTAGNLDQTRSDPNARPACLDEVGRLTYAINWMDQRIGEYTLRLEENTRQLDRVHHQIINSFEILKKTGEQNSLYNLFKYLHLKFQEIGSCDKLNFYVFYNNQDHLYAYCEGEVKTFRREEFAKTLELLDRLDGITLLKKHNLDHSLVSAGMQAAARVKAFPIHCETQLLGAVLVPCPAHCKCDRQNMELVNLVLNQSAGAIRRAVACEEERRDILRDKAIEYCGMIGRDSKMLTIYNLIENIAPADTTVLIQGESGTGKELAAQAIHQKSIRREKPFVVINCPAYPSNLIESELFGHEKGAFTGAVRQKKGRFEQAHGGTVFLDEIGEIPASTQIKLLRILQTQKFERVGGEKSLSVDVRIIAATNKDLLEEVRQGNFREDLYYRLNVIPLYLPPLNQRPNDIPLQAHYFLKRFAAEQDRKITGFDPEAMRRLLSYRWPGNVRELENCIEHAVVLAKGARIEISDLPSSLYQAADANPDDGPPGTIEENEVKLLQEVLQNNNWNKKQAAERLGISRNTLYRKIRKYQISQPNPI